MTTEEKINLVKIHCEETIRFSADCCKADFARAILALLNIE